MPTRPRTRDHHDHTTYDPSDPGYRAAASGIMAAGLLGMLLTILVVPPIMLVPLFVGFGCGAAFLIGMALR